MRNRQSCWVRHSTPLVDPGFCLIPLPVSTLASILPEKSSDTAGTFPSTGIGVCRAAAAASVSPSSASITITDKGWAHNPVEGGAVDMTCLNGLSAVALVKMNVQQKRARTQSKPKGGDNTLGRHCANRARLRRQGASAPTERNTQREQDKISILRGSQNIPPGHLDSPQDMPETL